MTNFLAVLAAFTATTFFTDALLPVTANALTIESRHDNEFAGAYMHRRGHNSVGKRKRGERNSRRCKPRENSGDSKPTKDTGNVNVPAPTSSEDPKPTEDSNNNNNNGGDNNNNGGDNNNNGGDNNNNGGDNGNNGGGKGGDKGGDLGGWLGGNSGDVNKAGINWFEAGDKLNLWSPISGKKGWFYNWTPEFGDKIPDNWEFVPMLWGYKNANDDWWNHVAKSGSKHVLAMNEPDQKGQANMNAGQLADMYRQYITPLKDQGFSLGLPATSSAPAGFDLIKDMIKQCGDGCPYDFVPTHWYDVDFQNFKDYQKKWHDEFGKPVWVTEFACQNFNGGAQCDEGKIWWFMTQATIWMDTTSWIERYCAFGTMRDMVNVNGLNQLMDPNTDGPNALGKLYINVHI